MSNIPHLMKAVLANPPGGLEALRIHEAPVPRMGPSEVLIKVAAAGINRPDILQREGRYDPPPGTSSVLGLEAAGEVVSVGEEVTRWKKVSQEAGVKIE